MIRIIVIAASPALRLGLRHILESDTSMEVVAEAASLDAPLPDIEDVDILVIANQGGWPSNFLEELGQAFENNAILLLIEGEIEAIPGLEAMSLVALGVLSLESTAEEIITAVLALKEGLLVGSPELVRLTQVSEADNETMHKIRFDQSSIVTLTGREAEVLQLLAQGLANKQIALELSISEHTVKFHISSIYAKLGVTSRTEAVREGIQRGMITL